MRFRSPTSDAIRIALTSGHVAIVDDDWRELPELFHYDAMRLGCERDDRGPLPDKVLVKPDANAMNRVTDHDTAYREALIAMLGRSEEGDFSRDNLPNVNAVSKLCGFTAKKEDVLRVFRALKDEAGVAGAGA